MARVSAIDGLQPNDPGVGLIAETLRSVAPAEVIEVGCGPIPGLPGARRLVLDVRELDDPAARPLHLATPSEDGFGHGVVWPRAHLGKDFTFACLALAAASVREGGHVWCAVRKAKGADSIGRWLQTLLGPVDVTARARGYRLLRATRTASFDPSVAAGAWDCRYAVADPLLGEPALQSCPGVFSRRELDAGTRALLQHTEARPGPDPAHVLDLGAGIGPITIFAGRRWPNARLWAVEPNGLAHDCLVANVAAHGLSARATVALGAGLDDVPALDPARGRIDLALVNPPTHLDLDGLSSFVEQVLRWLAPHGRARFVVSRPDALATPLRRAGVDAQAVAWRAEGYSIVEAPAG